MEKTYKILKLLIWVLAFAVVIVGASVLYNNLSSRMEIGLATAPAETEGPEETRAQASAAPDFTVYDLDGNAHKLSDFRGKPVILNFWASWCGPCKAEMPDFEEAYKTYGEEIQFLMVNLTDGTSETVESALGYIWSQEYTFPVYYDISVEGAMKYSVRAIPVTYFIDAEGAVKAFNEGMITADVLQDNIAALLKK